MPFVRQGTNKLFQFLEGHGAAAPARELIMLAGRKPWPENVNIIKFNCDVLAVLTVMCSP
jgi:hypothetical protein